LSLPALVPHSVLQALTSVLTREEVSGPIELIISSRDVGVNLREFAAYLAVMDRVYGRLSSRDLQEYSRRPGSQLKVAQFRSGSLDAVFTSAIEAVDAQHLLVLWLFPKYLPHGVREAMAGYRDYEEGRYARAQRQELEHNREQSRSPANRAQLRDLIREDPELRDLSAERVRQLARLLDALYGAEERRLPAAVRFARAYVLKIRLRIGTRERSD
jgi:hypothetical protein